MGENRRGESELGAGEQKAFIWATACVLIGCNFHGTKSSCMEQPIGNVNHQIYTESFMTRDIRPSKLSICLRAPIQSPFRSPIARQSFSKIPAVIRFLATVRQATKRDSKQARDDGCMNTNIFSVVTLVSFSDRMVNPVVFESDL